MKPLEYYKRLPYTLYREPVKDSDGKKYWTAEYVELRGCKTEGETESEAISNLQDLFDDYILTRIENKDVIPEPVKVSKSASDIILFVKGMSGQLSNVSSGVVTESENTNGISKYETNAAYA